MSPKAPPRARARSTETAQPHPQTSPLQDIQMTEKREQERMAAALEEMDRSYAEKAELIKEKAKRDVRAGEQQAGERIDRCRNQEVAALLTEAQRGAADAVADVRRRYATTKNAVVSDLLRQALEASFLS